MNYVEISDEFVIKKLNINHISEIYELCKTNPKYYEYSKEDLTREFILKDLKALPKGKSYDAKYYLGFYKNNDLLAVLDLIEKYPNSKTVFIGFFMVNKKYQGKKIGSKIIKDLINFLVKEDFMKIKLGVIEENIEAIKFWENIGFIYENKKIEDEKYNIMIYEMEINTR